MTNEEAIKIIVELCEYKARKYTVLTDEVIKKIDNKALYKAIETLKNEPFLNDALHKAHEEIKELNKRIEELKEKRPQGEWIDTGEMEEYWAEEYQCSICGEKDHWRNFCPNCGAKMKEEENE